MTDPSKAVQSADTVLAPAEMSVLIVDDQENMCKSIKAMLKVLKVGKRFAFAYNGQQALKQLKKDPLDFAIIDWNMPIMTGVELLNQIREDHELRDMPVIMVTAEANKEIVAEVAESDVDAYILKPLTVKSLGDKIGIVVKKVNDPPPLVVHLKKARQLEEAGDVQGAMEELQAAIQADPKSSRPVRELGMLHFRHDRLKDAETWLIKAARMNNLDVFAFHYLGEIYLRRDDIENAAKFFEKAMSISPRHVARAVYFGKILAQNNMEKKARKVFDKAISLSNEPLVLSEELADFAMENKMYDYAVRLYENKIKHVPATPALQHKLGIAYAKAGEYSRSLNYLMKAEQKDPKNIDIKLLIAKNHVRMGKPLRAEQSLQAALKLDPENETAKEMLRKNV